MVLLAATTMRPSVNVLCFVDAVVIPASGIKLREDILAAGICFGEGGHRSVTLRMFLWYFPK